MTKLLRTALLRIAELLNKNNIDWILIGSVNHELQGMEKEPRDIDIVVKLKKLRKVRNIFAENDPSEVKGVRPGDFNINFKINNVPVEIFGEDKAQKYFINKESYITTEEVKNTRIPCRKLEKELEFYKQLGREEKAEELKQFLDEPPNEKARE